MACKAPACMGFTSSLQDKFNGCVFQLNMSFNMDGEALRFHEGKFVTETHTV